jgi:hAT family C-terminal dimerisation region
MQALLSAIGTLPVSTAACERGFSKMNVVCSPLRSKLTVGHMSSLMFISIVGPPVLEWKPTSYVHSWIAKGRRNADSHECAQRACAVSKSSTAAAQREMWKLF